MNTNTQGHNHGGNNHLLGMLGIGGVVLVVLLTTGSSFGTALPIAAILAWPIVALAACALMMGGMMFMMMRSGNGRKRDNDTTNQPDHNDTTDSRNHAAPEPWQDSPNITSLSPHRAQPGRRWPPGPAPFALW